MATPTCRWRGLMGHLCNRGDWSQYDIARTGPLAAAASRALSSAPSSTLSAARPEPTPLATPHHVSVIENPFGEGLSDDPDLPGENQLEVLPLGRYCAEMASDAATLFSGCAFFAEEMPLDESDNVASFDDVA